MGAEATAAKEPPLHVGPGSVVAAIASRAALGFVLLLVAVPAASGSARANTITLQLDGEGGTVVSSPAGISCPKTCSASFDSTASVTLTATVSSGHRLERWLDGCDSGGGTSQTCTVRLQGTNRFVEVLFLPAGTLQVAPRGPGAISLSPVGIDASSGDRADASCDSSSGDRSCLVAYVPGTKVTLGAVPDPGGSFSDWSDPDCGRSGQCTVTVGDAVRTVVATFSKLRLNVLLSEDSNGDTHGKVTSNPSGIDCPPTCTAFFPAHSTVALRVAPDQGHSFRRWEFGCVPSGASCTVTMSDQPQWVGVTFDNDRAPQQPTTIKVWFEVRKRGSGSGRISSSGIDCGSKCSAQFGYGTSITLAAQPDQGSTFDGWGGVCKQEKTCTFPAGPVTAVQATFVRDTTPPSTPGGLTVTEATRSSISIAWSASSDNVGVAGYGIYLNGEQAGTTSGLSHTFDNLSCGTAYTFGVDAVDASGNRSGKASVTQSTSACASAGLTLRLVGVAVKGKAARRRVVVGLRVSLATTARLTLARKGKTVAARAYAVQPGSNALTLSVPKKAPAGRYQLAIAVRDPAGGSRVFTRGVQVSG